MLARLASVRSPIVLGNRLEKIALTRVCGASPGFLTFEKIHVIPARCPRRSTSFLASLGNDHREWHSPNFLSGLPVERKEEWLRSLLSKEKASSLTATATATAVGVDTEAFLVVLRGLAASKLPDAAFRSERWLNQLEKHPSIRPNVECYQRVIEAWSATTPHSVNPQIAVKRAERWLFKHLDGPDPSLRPDTACFNAFLHGCSKGRSLKKESPNGSLVRHHAHKANDVLRDMIERCRTAGGPQKSPAPPDTDSFNYVMRAWSQSRQSLDVADRAMETLRLLKDYAKTVDPSVRPNARSYLMVMDAINVRGRIKARKGSRPNQRSKNNKLRQDPSENGMEEVGLIQDIIHYMDETAAQQHGGDVDLAANTKAYNMLITAWANLSVYHPQAPFEAEKVLESMMTLQSTGDSDQVAPDANSYMLVMKAWADSDKPNRGKRVAFWLKKQWSNYREQQQEQEQEQQQQQGAGATGTGCSTHRAAKLTVDCYNVAIRTWANMGEPLKAEELLLELIEHSSDEQRKQQQQRKNDTAAEAPSLAPNSESFAFIIRAWLALAKRGNPEALATAAHWVQSLADREKQQQQQGEEETTSPGWGLTTSVEHYAGILGAARQCASQYPDVLDLAVETFDNLRASHHRVDCLHYSRLLQVGLLALSRPKDDQVRTSFVKQVVLDCAEDGLISRHLLKALANGPVYSEGWTIKESAITTEELFPDWPLPASWTRNIAQDGFIPSITDLRRTTFKIFRHGSDPYK